MPIETLIPKDCARGACVKDTSFRENRTLEQLEFVNSLYSLGEGNKECKVSPEVAVKMMKSAGTTAAFLDYPYLFMAPTPSGFPLFSPSEILEMGQFKAYFGQPNNLKRVLKNSRAKAGIRPIVHAEAPPPVVPAIVPEAEKLYCYCRGPDDFSPMIGCDGCPEWFHIRCVGIDHSRMDEPFFCSSCSDLSV